MISKTNISHLKDGEGTGLLVFGLDYTSIVAKKKGGVLLVEQRVCLKTTQNLDTDDSK